MITLDEMTIFMRPKHIKIQTLNNLMNYINSTYYKGNKDIGISGISLDTKSIRKGDLYIALPGIKTHGAFYVKKAIELGASAVLTDSQGIEIINNIPMIHEIPIFCKRNPRKYIGRLSSIIYGTENKIPTMFGITGTNGKTTTSYLIRSLLNTLNKKTGLIGTIEILAGNESIPSVLTTPEANDIHGLLSLMNEKKINSTVMEVSSHAIEFNRIDSLMFDVVGFTNLTQDHLDLHSTMENYFTSKAKLFQARYARSGVIIIDDVWGEKLAYETAIKKITLSLTGKDADWTMIQCNKNKMNYGHNFILKKKDGTCFSAEINMPGLFNIANAALAIIMVYESGINKSKIQNALNNDPFNIQVPGRMEVICKKPLAIVDFAHNPNAMKLAINTARFQNKNGKLIIVFGATGERDTGKRKEMAQIAAKNADIVIITDDDPHDEPAYKIRKQIQDVALCAAKQNANILNIAPRQQAIYSAVTLAKDEDTLLIAGRGHETVQEIMGEYIDMDDRIILANALNTKFNAKERIKL